MFVAFEEAKQAKRWDEQRKCYIDPQGNPIVDSKSVYFNAFLDVIPTAGELYSKKKDDKNFVAQMEKRIKEVLLASLKKKEEEAIDENVEMMVEKLKKTTKEAVMTEKTKVKTQTESSKSSNNDESIGNNDEIYT
ncbi:hypothetical protein Hanom_Chr17g01581911 [Helianthus anomalus]